MFCGLVEPTLPASLSLGGDLAARGLQASRQGVHGSSWLLAAVLSRCGGAVPRRTLRKRHFCGESSLCISSICAVAQLCCSILSFISARVWAEGAPRWAAPPPPSSPRGRRYLPVHGSQPLGHRRGEDQAHCARYSSDQSPSAHPCAQPPPQPLTAKRGCQAVSNSCPSAPCSAPHHRCRPPGTGGPGGAAGAAALFRPRCPRAPRVLEPGGSPGAGREGHCPALRGAAAPGCPGEHCPRGPL